MHCVTLHLLHLRSKPPYWIFTKPLHHGRIEKWCGSLRMAFASHLDDIRFKSHLRSTLQIYKKRIKKDHISHIIYQISCIYIYIHRFIHMYVHKYVYTVYVYMNMHIIIQYLHITFANGTSTTWCPCLGGSFQRRLLGSFQRCLEAWIQSRRVVLQQEIYWWLLWITGDTMG